jgi:hypothetical protein
MGAAFLRSKSPEVLERLFQFLGGQLLDWAVEQGR